MTEKERYLDFWGFVQGTPEAEEAWRKKLEMHRKQEINAPMVQSDIQPYRSQIDGSMITSRSKHREHLKQHNCIEIGNETKYLKPKPVTPPPGLKEKLIQVAQEKLRYK